MYDTPLCGSTRDGWACTRDDGHPNDHWYARRLAEHTVDLTDVQADLDARYGPDPGDPYPQGIPPAHVVVQVSESAKQRQTVRDAAAAREQARKARR